MNKLLQIEEFGKVVQVKEFIVKIQGLPNVAIGELVEINGAKGIIFKFGREFTQALVEEEFAWALMLEKAHLIKPGSLVKRLGSFFEVPVGKEFLGKAIDPLGRDLQTQTPIPTTSKRPIENFPPEIYQRENIRTPLETGIKIIDALFPIGRGQRELIVGDKKTGKTSIALDMALNQEEVISIYAIIGQKKSELFKILKTLYDYGKTQSVIVVGAFASDSVVLQFLAPFSAMTLAEYFAIEEGKDVLVIFDDLTKHAWAWRQIALLLGMPPTREAYPADIFYLHARLLERATNFKEGGSITAIPICETRGGDITEYIPTNLISITDGQLYLENNLFQKGIKPAINIGLSVSRVGALAQRKCLKEVTKGLKLILSQHKELKKLAQFETKLSKESQKILQRGELLLEIFKQEKHKLVETSLQAMVYWLVLNGFLDELEVKTTKEFEEQFYEFIDSLYPKLKKDIANNGFTSKNIKTLKKAFNEFTALSPLWQKSLSS